MLKNYFKIAWRQISRHKVYTTINVLGLSLGICACIVIFLITSYEFSFDRFHPDKGRIYRIVGEAERNPGENEFLNSPYSDLSGFQYQISGFEKVSGVHSWSPSIRITNNTGIEKKFDSRIEGSYVSSTIVTWPQYFDIFQYQWLAGNPQVLNDPFKVVLTEKRAHAYFGDISSAGMIGKTILYDDSIKVTVAGIVKEWTGNTDFGYTDFVSISTATHSSLKNQIPTEDWTSLSPHRSMAFVKLSEGTTAAEVNNRLASFINTHLKKEDASRISMFLQPLTDIHFTTDFHRGDDGDDFRKPYLPTLYTLIGVAIFILIIAIVNFINLSTAQSIQRSKEIGVRKVMGSNKSSIRMQFLTETLVLTLMSVLVSVCLVNPVLHLFKDYIPNGISFHSFQPYTLIFLTVITLLTTLLAGFYPAGVLASYIPVLSLKGITGQTGTEKTGLRKALIVFQFTISLVFITSAITIGKQINFMNNADKGFNSDAIITMSKWNDRSGKMQVLANNIKHIKGVRQCLLEGNAPMGFAQMMNNYSFKGKEIIQMQVSAQMGNEDFVPFYQLKMLAGRNMLHSDSLHELVVNETMAKKIGYTNPHDAVGKRLYLQDGQTEKSFPIVGVVADFHTGSFHEAIRPTVIENMTDRKFSLAIKLAVNEKSNAEVKNVLAEIEKEWKKIFPDTNFDYSFLNESITWLYDQEKKTAWLVNVAMSITIFISCMGLFGLAMFTAQKRKREIGIRKVLGASVANITSLLSKQFLVLILLSIIISVPIAWYFSNQWLQDFAYRTNISWWVFLLAGISAILIGLITVSFQAIKAAIANPVKSLRTE